MAKGSNQKLKLSYLGKLTKQGNPRHPLYMKSGEEFNWFPVTDYAANWLYPDCYF